MIINMEEINNLKQYLKEVEELECDDLNEEIMEMKDNINEAIKLKTEQLLEVARSDLLNKCCEIEESLLSDNESIKFDLYHESVGRKVGVNFIYNNGSYGIRMAKIIGKRVKDDVIQYRLVYLHPIYTSERLCHSVRDNCECDVWGCKYNHGVDVNEDQVKDITEEQITVGCTCLVRINADELWTRGKVLHMDLVDGTCVVELMDCGGSKLDHTYNVDLTQVVSHKDSSLEEVITLSDESDCEDVVITSLSSNKAFVSSQDKFGYWEAHTKGIGLKLLLKMGYCMGDGLGANNQGRVLPVTISTGKKTSLKTKKKTVTTIKPQFVHVEKSDNIKTNIVRNHDKISEVKTQIDQLVNFKSRNINDQSIVRSTENRISTLKTRLTKLEGDEKRLMKQQSNSQNKKKMNIF